ncbi:MAG: histidine phosphatase family protein [Patescibacteria group bacterium]
MTTVYFLRHGEYEGQDKFVAFRAKGFPLNSRGKNQIKKLVRDFANVAAIYSSPITRCLESAKIIGEKYNLKVTVDERLTEVKSPFNGIQKDKFLEIKGKNSLYDLPAQIAKGETLEEIEERMKGFLKEILRVYKNKTVVAVSHADPIIILRKHITGKDFRIEVGEYFKYEKQN